MDHSQAAFTRATFSQARSQEFTMGVGTAPKV